MVQGRPGLDVGSLVREVLAEDYSPASSRLADRLTLLLREPEQLQLNRSSDPYSRMFSSRTGRLAVGMIGNESHTLDHLSSFSVELLFEYMNLRWGLTAGPGFGRRFLTVPGPPWSPPALLILDPTLADVSQSRRITDEIELDPMGLIGAFESLRPWLQESNDDPISKLLLEMGPEAAVDMLWISRPEVILTRRPRMVPLCAPAPHLNVQSGVELSSVGVFCRDSAGQLGVTACFHGTGPIGTQVYVDGVNRTVTTADIVQDIVFIAMDQNYSLPTMAGLSGLRTNRAPSESEVVSFDGAGSGKPVSTRIKSHDAGILRKRPTVQLKVQTPADTNNGDSGSALIDEGDRVIGFAFERSGVGEFPELTDWIWASNALAALKLTPV